MKQGIKAAVAAVLPMVLLSAGCRGRNPDLASYRCSDYALLKLGEYYADAGDVRIFTAEKTDTRRFLVFESDKGAEPYELYAKHTVPAVPDGTFRIRDGFLFNRAETVRSSENRREFRIFPKLELSKTHRAAALRDFETAPLAREDLPADPVRVIDFGLTFKNCPGIYWWVPVYRCGEKHYFLLSGDDYFEVHAELNRLLAEEFANYRYAE